MSFEEQYGILQPKLLSHDSSITVILEHENNKSMSYYIFEIKIVNILFDITHAERP